MISLGLFPKKSSTHEQILLNSIRMIKNKPVWLLKYYKAGCNKNVPINKASSNKTVMDAASPSILIILK